MDAQRIVCADDTWSVCDSWVLVAYVLWMQGRKITVHVN